MKTSHLTPTRTPGRLLVVLAATGAAVLALGAGPSAAAFDPDAPSLITQGNSCARIDGDDLASVVRLGSCSADPVPSWSWNPTSHELRSGSLCATNEQDFVVARPCIGGGQGWTHTGERTGQIKLDVKDEEGGELCWANQDGTVVVDPCTAGEPKQQWTLVR
ncbi:hypothetical protein [Streptomyces enissocaesilis]|uniref:Ricin B lectin domain-containing protein n=1 Tax=Streptomyces enissocaesilis TaxID=332589 RepID=A0ABP6JZD6_9ACTN